MAGKDPKPEKRSARQNLPTKNAKRGRKKGSGNLDPKTSKREWNKRAYKTRLKKPHVKSFFLIARVTKEQWEGFNKRCALRDTKPGIELRRLATGE